MIVPPYITRAIRHWQDWREARQRQKRREMMLRASPKLRRQAEAHDRKIARHEPSKAEWLGMRDATTELLRRATHG